MVELPYRFDDLRPYYDSEIPAAMKRVAESPLLIPVVHFLGFDDNIEEIRDALLSVRTVDELQSVVMRKACRKLIDTTTDSFTYGGLENVTRGKGQLFVSNHRDIVMDAYMLQSAFMDNGIPTSYITFGSNLMNPQFVVDIGLSNKMFRTERKSEDVNRFIEESVHLSDFIRYVVNHGESVWIAQRNGRTKDGYDMTDQGLLRMLLLGDKSRSALLDLNITVVAVSYQWEPCDILKAVELYRSSGGAVYRKSPGEDLNSIITGITSPKGNVHIQVCKPLESELFNSPVIRRGDIRTAVEEMDWRIHDAYRLWDTNYVGCDLLRGDNRYSDYYSPEIKEKFMARMENMFENFPGLDREVLKRLFLNIYAGAVICREENETLR